MRIKTIVSGVAVALAVSVGSAFAADQLSRLSGVPAQAMNAEEMAAVEGKVLTNIVQRTKTRQVSGVENLNVMEWTTQNGPQATMDGAIVYFKLFKSAFGFFNKRFNRFLSELPEEWDDYGSYQDAAKKFSNGDINVANRMVIEIFEWFKPKQKMIGNQGGILILYAKDGGNGSLVAYADPNTYKSNNVAGILTGQSYINRVILSDDVFPLLPGADEFIQVVFEDQEGLVKIELPYILYKVPKR